MTTMCTTHRREGIMHWGRQLGSWVAVRSALPFLEARKPAAAPPLPSWPPPVWATMVPSELRGTVQVIGPLPESWTSMPVPAWTVTGRPLSFSVSTIVLGGGGQGPGAGARAPRGLAAGVTSQGGGGQGRTTVGEGPEGLVEAAVHGGGGQGRALPA